ncbi:MAG: PAS domain S-box protein [Spirochaetes bacterium]|jgi:PAS domain S-box-containing protein|nr:PAS domain S-box protein [Spirochaetota bacterium]
MGAPMRKKDSKETENKTAEGSSGSLQQECEKYRYIFEKSPTFTMILDTYGTVIEFNEAGEKIYGYRSEGEPLHFLDFIHENETEHTSRFFILLIEEAKKIKRSWDWKKIESDAAYREKCYMEINGLGVSHGSTKAFNKDRDRVFDQEFNVNLLVDRTTLKIKGFIITSIDVTERNLYKTRLEESKEKYRELFRSMPFFSMVIDTEGRAVEFNYRSMADYGIESDDQVVYFTDFVHRDDHDKAKNLFINLYTEANALKNLWINEKSITKEECLKRLRELGIWNEPIKLANKKGNRTWETEFSAKLWISVSDLKIKGALVSSLDVTERNLYRIKLEESEKKYRELVEKKTRDIIFSLDSEGKFLTANRNMTDKLGYIENKIIGIDIIEILYSGTLDEDQINIEIFRENLEKVLKKGEKSIRFNAVCNHKFLGEPVTLQFKLDPIMENGRINGVMGFATEISDDPIRQYLIGENQSFEIDNKLTLADEISYKLTRNLQKHFPKGKVDLLRLGLREMIVNAIEHGNLGITYDEKTNALENNTYHSLLRERQYGTESSAKKVWIGYELTGKMVKYTVRDCGGGFNYKDILEADSNDINNIMSQHGRGIIITRSIFDELKYNKEGNEVIMVTYTDRPE